MKRLKLSALLSLMLFVSACSTRPYVVQTESSPPASCLSECSTIPEAGNSLMDWSLVMLQEYASCAVKHNQCKTALVERITKEK